VVKNKADIPPGPTNTRLVLVELVETFHPRPKVTDTTAFVAVSVTGPAVADAV
jgi:hypothetical protein